MKTLIKIVLFAVFLIFNTTEITAQIEDHYHSFSGKIYVPIIVDRQEKMKFNDGRINEKHIPDKVTSISFYMKAENMHVSKGVFSGIIVKNNLVEDEVITYKGKVSKDRKKLEYIEITKDYTIYVLANREDVEKTIQFSARFENIPKSYGGYEYKFGTTNIASVSYKEVYAIKRYGYVDSYTETFVKINEKAIASSYYTGVSAGFKPGELILKLKNEPKIAVINQFAASNNESTFGKGISALFISELMKNPKLHVLERVKIQKLLEEIELSQSGLVNEESKVKDGRIMIPDVELIITQENRVPTDINLPLETFTLRSKIRIVKTGQVYNPNLIYNYSKNMTFDSESFEEYLSKVSSYAIHFLYE